MPAAETFPLQDYDSIAIYDEVCRKRFGHNRKHSAAKAENSAAKAKKATKK